MANDSYVEEGGGGIMGAKGSSKRKKCFIFGGIGSVVVIAAIVLIVVFTTKKDKDIVSEQRKEQGPSTSSTLLKQGTFQKQDANVAGTMEVRSEVDAAGKTKKFLFFKGVVVPAAPDLYLYLTPTALPTDIKAPGTFQVLLKGTDAAGHFAKAGDFRQDLADDFDETKFNGATIWCKKFAKNFGNLKLE